MKARQTHKQLVQIRERGQKKVGNYHMRSEAIAWFGGTAKICHCLILALSKWETPTAPNMLSMSCGIADVSNDHAQLLGYGYPEGEGARGGNNVASLLMQGLKDLGWLMAKRREIWWQTKHCDGILRRKK
jgi:hypothetical protein